MKNQYKEILVTHLTTRLTDTTTRWGSIRDQINHNIHDAPIHPRLSSVMERLSTSLNSPFTNPENNRFSQSSSSRLKTRVKQLQVNLNFLKSLEDQHGILNLTLIKTFVMSELRRIPTARTITQNSIIQAVNKTQSMEGLTDIISTEINKNTSRWRPWLFFKGSTLRAELVNMQERLSLLNKIQSVKSQEEKQNWINYEAEDKDVDGLISEILPSKIALHSVIEAYVQPRILAAEIKILKDNAKNKPKAARVLALFHSRLDLLSHFYKIKLEPALSGEIKDIALPEELSPQEKEDHLTPLKLKTDFAIAEAIKNGLHQKRAAITQQNAEMKVQQATYQKMEAEVEAASNDLNTISREEKLTQALLNHPINNERDDGPLPIQFYVKTDELSENAYVINENILTYITRIGRDFLDCNQHQDLDWFTNKLCRWAKLDKTCTDKLKTNFQDYIASKKLEGEQTVLRPTLG